MEKLLEDQVAIVTGGSGGIGKAIATRYASEGAKVVIFDINDAMGKATTEELNDTFGAETASFYLVNIVDTQQVKSVIEKVLEAFGRVDILVNNAGITKDNLLMKMTEEDWDAVLDVNLKSCYNTCQALIRPMMRAKKGKVINIASVIGLTGNAGQVNYASSKAGVIGFTKAMAKEVASRNICVNSIAPGYIATKMTDALSEEQKKKVLAMIPAAKLGTPEDVAQVALFLASPWSDYITGQVITVDGGMVM